MPSKMPICVHIIYHTDSKWSKELAQLLVTELNDPQILASMVLPVIFQQLDNHDVMKLPDLSHADLNLIILLADNHLVVDKKWHPVLKELSTKIDDKSTVLFPIQLSEHAYPVIDEFEGRNFLRAFLPNASSQDDEKISKHEKDTKELIPWRILVALDRMLHGEISGTEYYEVPIELFLSHTKMDLNQEPKVVEQFMSLVKAGYPIKAWYDAGDIESGSKFAERIEQGVEDTALLCILTDNYSSREWCRREIIHAKKHQRPIVIVDALHQFETRSFPYLGNVPVIHWNGNPQAPITLLVKEHVRLLIEEKRLENWKQDVEDTRSDYQTMSRPPELLSLLESHGKKFVYPDPPLGHEEQEILLKTGVSEITTPLEKLADHKPIQGTLIALSMSQSGDINKYGLTENHLLKGMVEISRYLLVAGAHLVYGGRFGENSYTIPLLDMIKTYKLLNKDVYPLINTVGWPLKFPEIEEQAKFAKAASFERIPRPDNFPYSNEPDFIPEPKKFAADLSVKHRMAWSLGMTAMRVDQVSPERNIKARIVLGGKFGPPITTKPWHTPGEKWYSGRIPGVLEEVYYSVKAGQPVFLLGCCGGTARLIIDLIQGIDREEATWKFQQRAPHSEELKQLYHDHNLAWIDYPEIIQTLRDAWNNNTLNPLLTREQNAELFTAIDPLRIVELILIGLRK